MEKILLSIAKNKKGIFFTSIAILISAVLILTFGTQTGVTMKDQIPITQAKADAANNQARDIKNSYLPQSLYIATYSAFYAMAEYMQQKGGYFSTEQIFNITLKEIMINGTMCCGLPGHIPPCNSDSITDVNNPSIHEGVDTCIGKQVMSNRNLTKRLFDMENASFSAYRVNTSFNKDYNGMALRFYQDNSTGPWQVGINVTFQFSIVAGDVIINSTENISAMFDIAGIPDPLYAVESQGVDGGTPYTNYFNRTNMTTRNISSFYHEIEWRLYKHEANASSFLDRFYGNDVRSPCCGVESLINPFVMGNVNGLREMSYVDWCYYGSGNRCTQAQTGALWNVTCVTTDTLPNPPETKFFRFAIDTYHAIQYNITNAQKDYLYSKGQPPPACPEIPFP